MDGINVTQTSVIMPNYKSQVMTNKKSLPKISNDSFNKSVQNYGFNESLFSKYNRTSLFNGYITFVGDINGKPTVLKQNRERTGLLTFKNSYNGYMGEKKVNLALEKNNISGVVDGKEVQLTVNKDFIGRGFSIVGKIGNKEILIQRGDSIKEAQGENDILTMCLSLHGTALKVKDGKFNLLAMSKQAEHNCNEELMMVMMQQQLMTQKMF